MNVELIGLSGILEEWPRIDYQWAGNKSETVFLSSQKWGPRGQRKGTNTCYVGLQI